MPVDWSSDGSQILVYFGRNAFAEEPSVSEFAFLSLKDGSMQVVKSLPSDAEPWMWLERQSPDGRYVVYTGGATEGS